MNSAYEWCDGSGLLVLELTQADVDKGHHQGACDTDISEMRRDARIESQLQALDKEHVKTMLYGCGAWEFEELADHENNLSLVLWLACADCHDNPEAHEGSK